MLRSAPFATREDDFLDELFDAALDLYVEGRPVELDEILAGRAHLRPQVEEVLALARAVAVRQESVALPCVPGYEIVRVLGKGASGTVYLARQGFLAGRLVALKVLAPAFSSSLLGRRRFLAEVRALARLRHPNVVSVYDVVESHELCAYAMEWVEGTTLARLLLELAQTGGPPDRNALVRGLAGEPAAQLGASYTEFVCHLGIGIACALECVHAAGLVHRDIKPGNILLRPDGTALLSDFGLARAEDASVLTLSGGFIGTPAYAAPEQLRGESRSVDSRADIYGLGATLYHALALRPPFAGHGPSEILRSIETAALEPLTRIGRAVPPELDTVVAKAMDPDPARRYLDATSLARDLQNVLEHRPIEARRPVPWLRARRWTQRHPAGSVGIAMGTVVLTGSIVFGFEQRAARLDVQAQKEEALRERDTATAVADYLVRLFRVSDPGEARGSLLTAREILDRGAENIRSELKDRPLVQAKVLDILGSVYKNLDVYERAADFLEEALAIRRRELGDASFEVAQTLNNLGGLRHGHREMEQAEALYREALEILRRLYPGGHPELATSLNNVAEIRRDTGDFLGAEPLYREALEMRTRLLGRASTEVAFTLQGLGHLYLALQDLARAEDTLNETLGLFAELHIESHPVLAQALDHLGAVNFQRGRCFEAARFFERSLAMCRRLYGENHLMTSYALESLGGLALEERDIPAAEQLYRQVLHVRRTVLPPAHALTMSTADLVGTGLTALRRYAEAEPILLENYVTAVALRGEAHAATRQALAHVVELYRRWNRGEELSYYEACLGTPGS